MAETRKCSYTKCGREFTPRRSYHKNCSRKCGTRAFNERSRRDRRARRETRPQRHPKARFIYEMLKEAAPGECPWGCEKPLPPGCRTRCREKECLRAYNRAYRIGRTLIENPPRTATCACGCGTTFETKMGPGRHKYVKGHKPKSRTKRLTFSQAVAKIRGVA